MTRKFQTIPYFFLILFLLIFNLILIPPITAVEVNDISIVTPHGIPLRQFEKSVWIKGIWHQINVSFTTNPNHITLELYYGNTPLTGLFRNETNYYQWQYYNNEWTDAQYNQEYIQPSDCTITGTIYTFFIGIDQYAQTGNWTLKISSGTTEISLKKIYVTMAVASLGLKSIPVQFTVQPFTHDTYQSNEKFTIENQGNVPLQLAVEYGLYQSIFNTVDFERILRPEETKKYLIMLQSKKTWPPGILTIPSEEISIRGSIENVIPPRKFVSLIQSNISIGLPIIMRIGRSGYELQSLTEEIIFQYQKQITIDYGRETDVVSFISGNGLITIDITSKDLDIRSISSGESLVESPFLVNSVNTSEHPITVRIKGVMPNSTGFIYYSIDNGGELQKYTTKVEVGTFQSNNQPTDLLTIIIIIILVLIAVYIIYTQKKHKQK
jgi:hypothetical protein